MKLGHYGSLMLAAARVEMARIARAPTLPYKLEYILTFSCGSRCRTCNIWKRYIDDPQKRSEEMTVDEVVRSVTSAKEHVRWISLTGGEITDREDLEDVCHHEPRRDRQHL
jgi:molybdenum cofactor biosynthesis enzyme MoaA